MLLQDEGFTRYLRLREIPEEQLKTAISIAAMFRQYCQKPGAGVHRGINLDKFLSFSVSMIEAGLNTHENYLALARFGLFLGNREIYRAALDMIDGEEAIPNLYIRLGETLGTKKRNGIFAGLILPPLGSPPLEKAVFTSRVMQRLDEQVSPDQYRPVLAAGLRDLQDDWYRAETVKFRESPNLDVFLLNRGEDLLNRLQSYMEQDKMFFGQEITPEVLQFLSENQAITSGWRQGNTVYEVKIPYLTNAYLNADNNRRKRYFCCHCPWVRESILRDDLPISSDFCLCSAAFVKKPWEMFLGIPLKAEVMETALQGDLLCKFAIHLPADYNPDRSFLSQKKHSATNEIF